MQRLTGRIAAAAAAAAAMWVISGVHDPLRAATGRWVMRGVSTVDLGTLGGQSSTANDINNAGEIVGAAELADGRRHAYKLTAAGMTDLYPLGSASAAFTITQRGVAGGWIEVPWARGRLQPAVFEAGLAWVVPHLARSPAPCQWSAVVRGLNDAGPMSGSAWLEGDPRCEYVRSAVYWNSRREAPIEYVGYGYDAFGYRINAAGLAVGSRVGYPLYNAFVFTGTMSRDMPSYDRTVYELCEHNFPLGINDAGNIVGRIGCPHPSGDPTAPPVHGAAIWYTPTSRPAALPMPGGATAADAVDINAQRFVAGTAYAGTTPSSQSIGFLWGENLGTVALPTLLPSAQCSATALTDLAGSRLTVVGTCAMPGLRPSTRAVKWNVELSWRPLM
jgi:probable HAF family extracellular repeat protein